MRVAFRVDSSNLIGAGHLTRCLKLAVDLKKKSKKIIFITKDLCGNFNNLIKKNNFKIFLIKNTNSKNKLNYDYKETKNICEKNNINTLIVDHYYLGLNWEKKTRRYINNLVFIDDFTNKKHYSDLTINNLSKKKTKNAKYLTGIKYMIIPNSSSKKISEKKNKTITVGIFFGSTDKLNCNAKILKIFSQKEFNKFKFISVLGKNNKNILKIKNNFKKYNNIFIKKNFENIKSFFKKIDILITVGGVISFEALLNNINCIYIPINHYQKKTCDFLKKKKIYSVLNYNKVFSQKGKKILINCLENIVEEKTLFRKKLNLDYLGSKRIANHILAMGLNKNRSIN